jgi:HEAT repeat protein
VSTWTLLWADPLYRWVIWTCLIQLVVLATLIGVIGAIRASRRRSRDVNASVVATISAAIYRFLAGETRLDELVAQISGYGPYAITATLDVLQNNLAGRDRQSLVTFARHVGLVKAGRSACRSLLWWRRLEGARMLGVACDPATSSLLLAMLDDNSLAVRLAAARALGRIGDPSHIEPLLRMLRRGRLARAYIADVLVQVGAEGRDRLRQIAMQLPDDPRNTALRATTIEVLALSGDVGATPFIQFALTSREPEVRVAALKAAAHARARLTGDEVRRALADPAWEVRSQAVRWVGRCQEASLARDVAPLLADTNWWVRIAAARALAALGPTGMELLEAAGTQHDDKFARGIALRVLTEDPAYAAIADMRIRLGASGTEA